jgi:hypothetical protein
VTHTTTAHAAVVTHGFDGTCELPVRSCGECMRAWLDRPCPKREPEEPQPQPDQRDWYEFDPQRAVCPACLLPGGECARCNGTGWVYV